jgi:uncharacterized protein (TIGR01777 family)
VRIAITGSTGLIGTALRASLEADAHTVISVTRSGAPGPDRVHWDPEAGQIDTAGLEGLDGVVHLAGEGIASGPWTKARKHRIVHSRTHGTALLSEALSSLDDRPRVLVSASGIDYYGDRGDEELTEADPPGTGFLPDLCVAWEAATGFAQASGIRVVPIRTTMVLSRKGGALGTQLRAFRLGLGGRAGSGDQWVPWITLRDHVRAVRFLLDSDVEGPAILGSPEPVRNGDLTRTLGKVIHRPTVLTIPRFARHLPLAGELVENLLFASKRARPQVLLEAGFEFRDPLLEPALRNLLNRPS